MKLSDFVYELPDELIAQSPAPRRDTSRLLVLSKTSGQTTHRKFGDLLNYLEPNDLLIMNNSRVFPARMHGYKELTHGKVEILLNRQIDDHNWEAIGKGLKEGARVSFEGSSLKASVINKKEQTYQIFFNLSADQFFTELDKIGEVPLPPYIKRDRGSSKDAIDLERYQTVYAKNRGSVAAPTAGLHFTPELLKSISGNGVDVAELTLHVGLGTFAPVKTDNIEEHKMHEEHFSISADTVRKIRETRKRGGRIVAVGTTTCRVLETIAQEILGKDQIEDISGETKIFIYPPYQFKIVDALVTNFHLPESTLLMLISALAGTENIKKAYGEAIKERYRFFSYGDAMLII